MQPEIDFFRCLNCGSSQSDRSGTSWLCRKCGSSYPVEQGIPRLVKNWQQHEEELNQAKAVKPGWYLEEQPPELVSPWRHHLRKRRQYVEAAIQEYLDGKRQSRATTMLDLGCGDGNHLQYLQNYAVAVFGSDYNLVRLVRSRARYKNIVLFLADILDYPAQDGFFEIIFFNHVLEHIHDDKKALETVFRILKPTGLLVLGVPNEGVWWWQLAYKLQPQTLQTTDHVGFYTAESIAQKLIGRGFKLLEIKHMGWGPPHWGLDMRIRKYKLVDDLFELVGKAIFPRQASSLYILATKS
jgi:SAM-dependent methyltransferase